MFLTYCLKLSIYYINHFVNSTATNRLVVLYFFTYFKQNYTVDNISSKIYNKETNNALKL